MIRRLIFLSFVVLIVNACASPAEVDNMVVNGAQGEVATPGNQFAKGVYLSEVSGGEETNPLWTSEVSGAAFRAALEQSLVNTGLASVGVGDANAVLQAYLLELDQDLFGLDLTVVSTVRYLLTEPESKEALLEETIKASHTATFSDSAVAVQRLRFANEGSIRKNIEQFIDLLLEKGERPPRTDDPLPETSGPTTS